MLGTAVRADPVRIAFWHTELSRKGPGLLLKDVTTGDPQVAAIVDMLARQAPDVLVLAGIDYDHDLVALSALRDAVQANGGTDFPSIAAPRPNAGMDTGLDLNGDGRLGGPEDAQGYGRFAGQGGLAVISRFPVELIVDHSARLWRDIPDSLLVDHRGREGLAATGAHVQRLSTIAHAEYWIHLPDGDPLTLMIFHATPPVFDGPEDRNGRRNHDEITFWRHRLDGAFGPPPDHRFIVAGAANLAPVGSDGRTEAIKALLADPRLQDPPGLTGKPTVDWPHPGPGALRVDYILPSSSLTVLDAGVATDPKASRHALIWADIAP